MSRLLRQSDICRITFAIRDTFDGAIYRALDHATRQETLTATARATATWVATQDAVETAVDDDL
jgi:hypothetical protein